MSDAAQSHIVRAASSRRAAALFSWGNIIALLLPMPLGVLWLGGSMVLYAMNRHHPNPRVGHYTQQAAYRFYGVVGFVVAAAVFIPGNGLQWWLGAWGLCAAVLIPWSLFDLWRIRCEVWQDVEMDPDHDQRDQPL